MGALEGSIPGRVVTRREWGGPTTPGGARRPLTEPVGLTVHWTTGRALGVRDTVAWWKRIFDYHTGHNGWADVGYAYGVDRFGNVMVGRGRYRQLAHASGYNRSWVGVAYMGGHDSDVTPEGKAAILGLWQWLRSAEGGMTNLRRRNGHRDLGATSCPGDRLHRWVHDGMPAPNLASDPQPDEAQPDGADAPDWIVAVTARAGVDEGMARVLGATYAWRYLDADGVGHADPLEDVHVGTLVRVGAAVSQLDADELEARGVRVDAFHDLAGPDRHATARVVADRIDSGEGDSRNVD